MKIIFKYYDNEGKLKILKNKLLCSKSRIMRFKVLGAGNLRPCCDFNGNCTNVAYAEVYPFIMKKSRKKGWSYLCRKHYYEEQKRLCWRLPACLDVK